MPMHPEARRAHNKKRIVVAVIGDGYLYGGSSSDHAHDGYSFWRIDEPFALYYTKDMPTDLAQKLEDQGTSGQSFSDGYVAMRAAIPYLPKRPFYKHETEEHSDEDGSPRRRSHRASRRRQGVLKTITTVAKSFGRQLVKGKRR